MIIVGAKGFAKELLEVAYKLDQINDLVFFDNISNDLPDKLFGQFPIIQKDLDAIEYFNIVDNRFALGLGNPKLRKQMYLKFEQLGGKLTALISPNSNIGSFGVNIGNGATILSNATITNSVTCGIGLLMYPNAVVTHDCVLGDFVELSPGAKILGNWKIGDNVHIGANATILPNVKLSSNVIVGAGAVVTKDVSYNKKVMGVPAK
jgi:sugar O-acyltransferase (sialic acid O-acetyltransferase NeuD family)